MPLAGSGPSPLPVLPLQLGALTPLHIAAALPGEEGVRITELLLHAVTDVDATAADQDDVYKPGKVRRPAPWGRAAVGPGGPLCAPCCLFSSECHFHFTAPHELDYCSVGPKPACICPHVCGSLRAGPRWDGAQL